ncbi:hypothetical protein OROGR_004438 [Orobanche gracilis]
MLDINLFRVDKGGDPEKIRVSQRRRFADADLVDEVIKLDQTWRQRQFGLETLRKDFNKITREVARLKINGEDANVMIASTENIRKKIAQSEVEVEEAKIALESKLRLVGNIVHHTVPISNNEAENELVRSWGDDKLTGPKLKDHVELVKLLGIADIKKGPAPCCGYIM